MAVTAGSGGKQLLVTLLLIAVLSQSNCSSDYSFKNHSFGDILEKRGCYSDSDCPLWAFCNEGDCLCREKSARPSCEVKCSNYSGLLSVLRCSCVTYDSETKVLTVGRCMESCGETFNLEDLYFVLPNNLSKLNQFMCEDKLKRTGRLCGKCLPGHAPLAYSYDIRCISCPEGNKNIWKYILMVFGPLTIFYFIVVFFKINATSSHLHGYLYFSQTISIPLLVRASFLSTRKPLLFNILIAFYSMWTLDILRSLHPEICLSVSALTIFAMDYVLAIYPLLLTCISYALIELHDRNYRVIVLLWKPFRYVFTLVRRNWNARTTVIDAYATFFILSFMKILNTTVDILTPTIATDLMSGNTTWVVFMDGTVDYFGAEHLPYAILAIVLCTVLTVTPMLLLVLYPFRWFQRVLTCLKLKGSFLQTVMDSFQGCYKDGTESGTRDYRWFAGMPLIARFVGLCLVVFAQDSSYFPWGTAIVVITLLLELVIQPYKASAALNAKIDAIFLGMLALFFVMIDSTNIAQLLHHSLSKVNSTLLLLSAVTPLFYMVCISLYWILSRMRRGASLISCIKARISGYHRIHNNISTDTECMPDRLVNPEEYRRQPQSLLNPFS